MAAWPCAQGILSTALGMLCVIAIDAEITFVFWWTVQVICLLALLHALVLAYRVVLELVDSVELLSMP